MMVLEEPWDSTGLWSEVLGVSGVVTPVALLSSKFILWSSPSKLPHLTPLPWSF